MIKVLRFRASNWTSNALSDDEGKWDFYKKAEEVDTGEDIQAALNDAIASVDHTRYTLQDVIVTPALVHQHNNGRGNTVDLFYTLVFKRDGKGRGRES